jgi:hypothetical protein
MTDLVKYPTEILQAVYDTHRYTALDKLAHGVIKDARRFYGRDVVLEVKVTLWEQAGRQTRLYQLERQVLRAIYVLAHQQNNAIVRFTPAQLMDLLGYQRRDDNDFSSRQRHDVHRALHNLFEIYVEVLMLMGSGGKKKLYGHFLDSYRIDMDRDGHIQSYAVQVNVLIGADLSRFKLMPAALPKLITAHGPDQAVTTFADFCLLWEGQTVDWSLDAWMDKLHLDPARRTRNQAIIERCAQWGMDNGLVRSWSKGRMQDDQRRVKYTIVIAPQRYGSARTAGRGAAAQLRSLVEQFYTMLGTKASAQKLARDVAVATQLCAEGYSLEDLTFAVEWVVQHIPSVTSFGLLPHIMHHAIKAQRQAQDLAEAKRAADAQVLQHLAQEQEEEARAQRLEAWRAALSAEQLDALRQQVAAALAHEGHREGGLGYATLLRLGVDALLEQAWHQAEAQPSGDAAHVQ